MKLLLVNGMGKVLMILYETDALPSTRGLVSGDPAEIE